MSVNFNKIATAEELQIASLRKDVTTAQMDNLQKEIYS